ncbi:MAG: lysophospholipid acyltransferase family protein [Methylovirgula sp.]
MAYLRAAGVFATLIVFFVVGAPVQWLILRLSLPVADVLPLLFNRMLLYFLQIRVIVHGETAESAAEAALPQLLVANHVSWTDIPALGTIHSISFLAKREVAGWPIIATFARLQRTLFVDRLSRKSIRDANAAMAARMLEGGWVALFPEGTTHDGTELGRFHSSHFAAARDLLQSASHVEAVRVQPVAIRYSAPHAAWLGDDLLLPHVMELVKGAPVTCDLFFCAPVIFDRASDRKEIAQECNQRIEAMLAATAAAGTAAEVALQKV